MCEIKTMTESVSWCCDRILSILKNDKNGNKRETLILLRVSVTAASFLSLTSRQREDETAGGEDPQSYKKSPGPSVHHEHHE